MSVKLAALGCQLTADDSNVLNQLHGHRTVILVVYHFFNLYVLQFDEKEFGFFLLHIQQVQFKDD